MITIETQISGGQIGRKLADDPEELFYALTALAETAGDDLGEDLASYCYADYAAEIASLLRNLLVAVECAK